jgi:flagellar hook-associated protein 2
MSTIRNGNDPYEQLIAQMIRLERQPQVALRTQRSETNVLKGVLTDFNSALSSLRTSVRTLSDPVTNAFAGRSAQVPEGAGFQAAVTDRAAPGAHTLTVERLATADARVSRRLDAGGGTLAAFFAEHGAQTFSVEVAAPTDAEPARRVALAVSVDVQGGTDAEILEAIRAAIRQSADAAVADGTLESRHRPAASVVQETTGTARLSVRSAETGFEGRLAFTDSAGGLLAALELNADAVSSGASGGQITAVGASDEGSALNARFQLDGLTLVRSRNTVADALEGVTLTLTAPREQATFRVGPNADAAVQAVESFLKRYNEALGFIARRTTVNAESGTRGEFAGDASIRGLRFGMREDVQQTVPGQPEGIAALRDLGITVANDGTLKLSDKAKLVSAAERDPAAVQRLFSAEPEGIGARLSERLGGFLGSDGLLRNRRTAADARIRRLDARIKEWDTRLDARENALRKEFARVQETIASLQGQQAQIGMFYFGYY